jgi:hypothetical protein
MLGGDMSKRAKSGEIIEAYRRALIAYHGYNFADQFTITFSHGWYYIIYPGYSGMDGSPVRKEAIQLRTRNLLERCLKEAP